ncbi:MAG: glycoside hydrolase family 127 protein [Treponema sp.]|nr:glycoside hydrolase family 127 protein [Treponema sp.]
MADTSCKSIAPGYEGLQYFGKWTFDGGRRVTRSRYSCCYLNFRGGTAACTILTGPGMGRAAVYLDGTREALVDLGGGRPEPRLIFEKHGIPGAGVHNLRVVALEGENGETGLEIAGFKAEEPVNYPAWLRERMEKEYRILRAGKKVWTAPEAWKPVPYGAESPQQGVRVLPGLVRGLLDANIRNIKYCFSIPDYCEGEPMDFIKTIIPTRPLRRGWVSWLPASNEARLLGGAAEALRWEEDGELRRVVDTITADIKNRMRDDGYYNYYHEEVSYALRHFPENISNRDTDVVSGLTDRKNYDRVFWTRALLAAHSAGNAEALNLARRMYDWFNACEYLPDMLLGGNATNGFPGGPLMYHSPAGKDEDLITNLRYYDQDYWFDALAERQPMALSHYPGDRPHCYDILAFETLADQYRATGERKYLDALLGAWDIYRDHYKHPGGATAICESDGPYPPDSYYLSTGHTGELCGGVFWIWTNDRLMRLFPGEEKYAAEIEESLFNVVMGCRDKKGHTTSHASLHGKKWSFTNENTCCEVSSTLLISSLPQYIYTINKTGLFVNLFVPSELETGPFRLRLETGFPLDGNVKLMVHSTGEFAIRIRIPAWVNGDLDLTVTGGETITGSAGTYRELRRFWRDGDEITFTLPLEIRAVEYTGFDQSEDNRPRYALRRGPVMLALLGDFDRGGIPRVAVDPANPSAALACRNDGGWDIRGETRFRYVPYYTVTTEVFTCYPVFEYRR